MMMIVATSAQIPIRFFKFQWGFYDHRNGSERSVKRLSNAQAHCQLYPCPVAVGLRGALLKRIPLCQKLVAESKRVLSVVRCSLNGKPQNESHETRVTRIHLGV